MPQRPQARKGGTVVMNEEGPWGRSLLITKEATLKLAASIIEIGRALGIGATAESVLTMACAKKLQGIDCGVLQGFPFSTPRPADALALLMSSRPRCLA